MSSFGTGVGGTVGGPSVPTPREQEATAAMAVSRMLMGITKDTIEKPFSQIDPEAAWKYKSTASNPTIAPLHSLRLSLTPDKQTPSAWVDQFEYLLSQLPADIRQQLILQSRLPLEERDPAYSSLDSTLGTIATLLFFINNAATPVDASVVNATHIPQYLALTQTGLTGLLETAIPLSNALEALLASQGANTPWFDATLSIKNEIGNSLAQLSDLSNSPQTSANHYVLLAEDLTNLNSKLQEINAPGNLQILKSLVDTMSLITTAMTLPDGVGPLLIGLALATIGLSSSDSQAAVVPPAISTLADSMTNFLGLDLLSHASVGQAQLAPLLLSTLFLAALSSTVGLSSTTNPLTLNLILQVLLNSGIIEGVSTEIASVSGASAQAIPLVSTLYSLTTTALILQVLSQSDESLAKTLLSDLRDRITTSLDSVEQALSSSSFLSVNLQQIRIALEREDIEGFTIAMNQMKEELKTSEDQDFSVQLREFESFIKQMLHYLKLDKTTNSTTGILQA